MNLNFVANAVAAQENDIPRSQPSKLQNYVLSSSRLCARNEIRPKDLIIECQGGSHC